MESPMKHRALAKGNKSENNREDDWDHNTETPKRSTGSKHFMSQTISAASKASKKKILGERNDASDAYLAKSITPRTKLVFHKENESASKSGDSSAPRAKFVRYNPERRRETLSKKEHEATRVTPDSSYDPVKNYLSPRPKFLWYDPDRSRERLIRNSSMFGDEDCSTNSDQSEQADDLKCKTPPCEENIEAKAHQGDVRTILVEESEEKTPYFELGDSRTDLVEESDDITPFCEEGDVGNSLVESEDAESDDDEEEKSVWGFTKVIKVGLFLLAMAVSSSFIFTSDSGDETVTSLTWLDYEPYNRSSYDVDGQQMQVYDILDANAFQFDVSDVGNVAYTIESDVDEASLSTHYLEYDNDDVDEVLSSGCFLEEEEDDVDRAFEEETEPGTVETENSHFSYSKDTDDVEEGSLLPKEEDTDDVEEAKHVSEERGLERTHCNQEEYYESEISTNRETYNDVNVEEIERETVISEDSTTFNETPKIGETEAADKTSLEAMLSALIVAMASVILAAAAIRKRILEKTETEETKGAGTPVVKLLHEMEIGDTMKMPKSDNSNPSSQITNNEEEAPARSSRKNNIKPHTPVRRSARLQQSRAVL